MTSETVKPLRTEIPFRQQVGKSLHPLYTEWVKPLRGHTFPEILVAGFCLLLLLGMMAPLLGRTTRVLQRSDQDATAQHEALIAVQRFFSVAAYSDSRSLTLYGPDPTLCSFLSTRELQSTPPAELDPDDFYKLSCFSPHCNWQKFMVVYYRAAAKKLLYKEFVHQSNEIARVDSNRLSALAYRNDASTFTITPDVVNFQLANPRQGQLWVSVTTERKWDKTFRSQLSFMLTLRN